VVSSPACNFFRPDDAASFPADEGRIVLLFTDLMRGPSPWISGLRISATCWLFDELTEDNSLLLPLSLSPSDVPDFADICLSPAWICMVVSPDFLLSGRLTLVTEPLVWLTDERTASTSMFNERASGMELLWVPEAAEPTEPHRAATSGESEAAMPSSAAERPVREPRR
jgi:hypothetical protein